ncbi:MAG TPA: hypothetical protein GX524_05620 [Firmicutes bacterium]|nr:hypothetical protein [Bacillota bacterium]
MLCPVLKNKLNIRKLAQGEQEYALLLTAATMAVIIGFSALVIDGGYLHFTHARLQDVADSSALAGAKELVKAAGNPNKKKQAAFGMVIRYASLHGFEIVSTNGYTASLFLKGQPGELIVSFPSGLELVEVELSLDARVFFASASLKISSCPVRARSSVMIGQAARQKGWLLPIAFFWGEYQWYTRYDMTLAPGDGASGNYGFLDYKPSNMFSEYLQWGFDGSLTVGQVVETYPGVSTGQVSDAILGRLAACTHSCRITCVNETLEMTIEPLCPRVVVIPIVADFYEQSGKGYVTISGFAKFFIENYNKDTKVMTGWFLQEVSPSEITGSTSQFTIQAVKLVK